LHAFLIVAMRDSANEVENRRNQVSAEPAQQKAALPTDKVRFGTPQGCAGEVSFSELPGEERHTPGRQCRHVPRPRAALACRPAAAARCRLHALIA
jgi:hypothetical protein